MKGTIVPVDDWMEKNPQKKAAQSAASRRYQPHKEAGWTSSETLINVFIIERKHVLIKVMNGHLPVISGQIFGLAGIYGPSGHPVLIGKRHQAVFSALDVFQQPVGFRHQLLEVEAGRGLLAFQQWLVAFAGFELLAGNARHP